MDSDDFQVECLLDIRALTIRCDRAPFSVCLARQLNVIRSSGSDVAIKTKAWMSAEVIERCIVSPVPTC